MKSGIHVDPPLCAIIVLLAGSLTGYWLGIFAYPFGFLLLLVLLVIRILHLQSRRKPPRDN
jgi:hypothetical protein